MVDITVRARAPSRSTRIGATLYQSDGSPVGSAFSAPLESMQENEERNVRLELECADLTPGRYWFRLGLLNPRNQLTDLVDEVLHFEVPHDFNVPREFLQWDRGWGPIRLRLHSRKPAENDAAARASDAVRRN